MKALLLSAGLGTRLKPFTDKHPKALAPVHGRSLLEWNIRNLQRFGIFDIVVNVHHFASQIINTLHQENGFGSRFEISDESDAVLETGGGLKKAAPFFNQEQNLLVMNVDMLTNADIGKMISQHKQSDRLATLAVQQRQTSRYFLFDESMRLKGWENTLTHERKPSGITGNLKQFAFSGIQILSTEIFTKITREGKFSLVDVYLDLCTTENIIGLDHTGDLLLDVGKPESIAQAETLFSAIH
jgi:N-acetyl-alpha-D-muramate 1-phosphate uridylyltransferase